MLRDAGLANFNYKGEQNISKYFLRVLGAIKNKLEQLYSNWHLGKLMTQLFPHPPPPFLHILLTFSFPWY